ncbi:unnamed protein product, partial [marine sediment metagenome]
MSTIHQGAMEIMLGYSDLVISCGIEHMTHNPMLGPGVDLSKIMIKPNPRLFTEPEYKKYDIWTTIQMGLTAEKLFEQTGFNREDMDKWALRSHNKAAKALEEG